MKVAFTRSVKATLKGCVLENPTSETDPLEQRIAAELWQWAFLDEAARAAVISPQSDLAGSLEYYLCGLFDIIPQTQAKGWWCDGVVDLEIAKLNRTTFRIIGGAYLMQSNSCWIALFELEFYFEMQRGVAPRQVIFRIRPDLNPNDSQFQWSRVETLRANRPPRDRDWAIAVTITPDDA
ncbi:MAG: hypothetical protein JWN70_8 [Planctomycetaceae bacterium]|nr:hypothetical protein [Planctomycetaceae bacterium]